MMAKANISNILATNLRALMRAKNMTEAELHKKSGVSPRMIAYILAQERVPTVKVTEALAQAFGLVAWQLQLPNLPIDIAVDGSLDKLVHNYAQASSTGRDYINRVAEQEAKYRKDK